MKTWVSFFFFDFWEWVFWIEFLAGVGEAVVRALTFCIHGLMIEVDWATTKETIEWGFGTLVQGFFVIEFLAQFQLVFCDLLCSGPLGNHFFNGCKLRKPIDIKAHVKPLSIIKNCDFMPFPISSRHHRSGILQAKEEQIVNKIHPIRQTRVDPTASLRLLPPH